MAQNVLNYKGNVIPRRSIRRLTQIEWESESEKRKRDQFTKKSMRFLVIRLRLHPLHQSLRKWIHLILTQGIMTMMIHLDGLMEIQLIPMIISQSLSIHSVIL